MDAAKVLKAILAGEVPTSTAVHQLAEVMADQFNLDLSDASEAEVQPEDEPEDE